MKIAFNGKFYAQPLTGVQRYARELLNAFDQLLEQRRYADLIDAELIVPECRSLDLPRFANIKTKTTPGRNLHIWEQFQLPILSRNRLLVNLSGSAPLLKRQQLCTFHDAAVFDAPFAYKKTFVIWYRSLFLINSKIAKKLITVSQFSRGRLSSTLNVSGDRIEVIPNGSDHFKSSIADNRIINRLGIRPNEFFLIVASSSRTKNIELVTSAISEMPNLRFQFVFVGRVNDRAFRKHSFAKEHQSQIWAGAVSDSELLALYRNARALIIPSTYEGFGIPAVEAMSQGCPVFSSTAASLPEICGESAAYFDPYSVSSLKEVLERAIDDNEWLSSLRRAGLRQSEKFTWRNAAEQLARALITLTNDEAVNTD